MHVTYSPEGIYLQDIDLWLDPRRSQPVAWLSHAHSDHARGSHGTAVGSPDTLEIYALRAGEQAVANTRMQRLAYGESLEYNGATLTALPAGHILGAAQLLVEFGGERLVYTGDIKLRPPLCGATTEVVPCDHLIMECTFGLPVFHFLSRQEAIDRIVAFARECLADGDTPAFLGYALGRGQEIAHVLASHGVPTMVHGAIARYFPWYERAGYAFGDWVPYQRGKVSANGKDSDTSHGSEPKAADPVDGLADRGIEGRALVAVPSFRTTLQASASRVRIAYVSGWASMDNARARTGAEALIPYSDHGDFPELLGIVEQSRPKRVDAVHGFTEVFASILRNKGVEAHAPAAFGERGLDEEVSA
jgi:Cft2 family RNA processing exonuclease